MQEQVAMGISEADVVWPQRTEVFLAYSRSIVVGTVYLLVLFGGVYGFRLLDSLDPSLSRDPVIHLWVFGLLGFAGGSVVAFGNVFRSQPSSTIHRDNALDALMMVLWASNVLLLSNVLASTFGFRGWQPSVMFTNLLALAFGSCIGGLIGQPVLSFLGNRSLKGFRPFPWINEMTSSIENGHTAFSLRVFLHTAAVLLLATLAFLAFVIFITILFFWLTFFILSLFLGDSSGRTYVRTTWFNEKVYEHEDGSVSRPEEGWFGEKRIRHEDGSVSRHKEGWFGGKYLEHEDGSRSEMKEGWLGDKYLEHEDGSRANVGEDIFGDKYYEHEGETNPITGQKRPKPEEPDQ